MANNESLNINVIKEFERLVNYVYSLIDEYSKTKNIKELTANQFRLKHIKNSLSMIKKYNKELNNDTINEFSKFPGIGKGTVDRIKEIITNGFLKELVDFTDTLDEKEQSILELESIVGVGRITANEYYNMGIKNIKQLKKAIKNNEIKVNDKIMLGLKYYKKFLDNIPRNEIDEINLLISNYFFIVHSLTI